MNWDQKPSDPVADIKRALELQGRQRYPRFVQFVCPNGCGLVQWSEARCMVYLLREAAGEMRILMWRPSVEPLCPACGAGQGPSVATRET